MNEAEYDFAGWATRSNLLCGDGRVISDDAFAHYDGITVPLVWNHQHSESNNVLGKALLKNTKGGVRVFAKFNDTESGENAKKLVKHGDITSLSIYANGLKHDGNVVTHGNIREVSLVLAGANPGAYIDDVSIEHSENGESGEAILYTGYGIEQYIAHADEKPKEEIKMAEAASNEKKEKTIGDVFNEFTDEQKKVVYALIGAALEEQESKGNKGEKEDMKHNVFDNGEDFDRDVLIHAATETIIKDGKKFGSMKESFLAHADEYGIGHIDYLFPDAKSLNTPPEFIKRDTGWVPRVMNKVHHTPFSRIKSVFADITEDDARAKGYIKGNMKKEEFFSLMKRTTTPTTIYKKQKMDRDDVIDITDFDVIAWIKTEMRMMLDEEIARAILVGDGRLASSDDKINESNIRPIWTDYDLYTIKYKVDIAAGATDNEKAKAFIRACVKSRKNYKGSGNPALFTTEDLLTDCLLVEDTTGRKLYESENSLATALRVSEIITVPVMENLSRDVSGKTRNLCGIIVNLSDYNVGADKGGAINMFDDFDIDLNRQKYLIETRISGALIKPYSAIALEIESA